MSKHSDSERDPLAPPSASEDDALFVRSQNLSPMRIRLLILAAVLLATLLTALLVYGVTAQAGPDVPGENEPDDDSDENAPQDTPAPPTQHAPPPEIKEDHDYACDVSAYLSAIEMKQAKKDIPLLNKTHPRDYLFAPDSLVPLDPSETFYGKEILLDSTTATALRAMLLCMRADGITDTFVVSGYRSYQYQGTVFSNHVNKLMKKDPTLSRDQATEIVSTYSACAGQSEHQSGLCVDLITTAMSELNETFAETAAYTWLQENAAQFGFILRYPKDKSHITGYIYEPWHYRFIGKAAALEITAQGLTLEEYLGELS